MLVNPNSIITGGPDPDDLPLVATALCVPEKIIVTGNFAIEWLYARRP